MQNQSIWLGIISNHSRGHPQPLIGVACGHPQPNQRVAQTSRVPCEPPQRWPGVAASQPSPPLGIRQPPLSFSFFLSFLIYLYFFNKSNTCNHFIGVDVDTNGIHQVF
jgi:hypothetical protein